MFFPKYEYIQVHPNYTCISWPIIPLNILKRGGVYYYSFIIIYYLYYLSLIVLPFCFYLPFTELHRTSWSTNGCGCLRYGCNSRCHPHSSMFNCGHAKRKEKGLMIPASPALFSLISSHHYHICISFHLPYRFAQRF